MGVGVNSSEDKDQGAMGGLEAYIVLYKEEAE